jgi:two-component system, LytTR family, sensor kinase
MAPNYSFSGKQFAPYNTLVLSVLFCFTWAREALVGGLSIEDMLFWPGGYFLSLWILSPLALYFFKSLETTGRRTFIKQHLAISTGFGMLHFILTGLVIILLERFFKLPEHYNFFEPASYIRQSWPYAVDGMLWYWGYIFVFLYLQTRERLAVEKQKSEAIQKELAASDLSVLRTELNPHFLFNAMNSIAMKVRLKENKLAVAMIASLNDLLRSVLSRKRDKTVPLSEEIELLNKYLMIERVRFGEQVEVTQDFNEDLLPANVPQMILQPLVENAFKHGVKDSLREQKISITGAKESGALILTVFNTTEQMRRFDTANGSEGVGLPNVIHRLRRHYGTDFRFQCMSTGAGIAFRITLPFRTT